MKKQYLFLLGILTCNLACANISDTIPASNPFIEYTGRIDFSNPAAPRFSYPGASIRASFSGTGISILMDDEFGSNYFTVILDGMVLPKLKAEQGLHLYILDSDLADTVHEVEIFKSTEQDFGKTSFNGFILNEGKSLSELTNKRIRFIEYIGNSITCGYGNEGINGGQFSASTENHYLTYAAFTSRNFNARHLAVCKSGIGIYRNYNGATNGSTDCMLNYYSRIYLYDENPKYDFKQQPDLICIDLGTNDFSTSGGDSAKYVNAFLHFIDTLQLKYSKPEILCLLGPMLSGGSLINIRKYLKHIVDSANLKGRGNVYFFEMSQQQGDLGIGIDYHPTVKQHLKNGLELTNYISKLKGWNIVPIILQADVLTPRHIKVGFTTELHDSTGNYKGFSVMVNELPFLISETYPDTLDAKQLHIWLSNDIGFRDSVVLNYKAGSVENNGDIHLKTFSSFKVNNLLTETKITAGSVNSAGKEIYLTYNKQIKLSSVADSFTVIDNRGIHNIDSFLIKNNILILYLHEPVIKKDTVFVSYYGSGIRGQDDIAASQFNNMKILNGSKYTSVELIKQDTNFVVYPNPSVDGIINYDFHDNYLNGKTFASLYDAQGRKIFEQNLPNAQGIIDLGTTCKSKGLFFLIIKVNGKTFSKKLIL